jgi:hypothetical protein
VSETRAQRTLVKSPPELWEEVSDPAALARHLGEFGEIRITKMEPESTVAWEGERARGMVELEPSGWGTKVTLTIGAAPAAGEVADQPALGPESAAEPGRVANAPAEPPGEPESAAAPEPPSARVRRRGLLARLFPRRRQPTASAVTAVTSAPPQTAAASGPEHAATCEIPEDGAASSPAADPPADDAPLERADEVLKGMLDALGAAHHRPFSRA